MDISQTYSSQPQLNNPNLNDYLTQPSSVQNRFVTQTPTPTTNPRLRIATNSTNFLPPPPSSSTATATSTNSNDVLHQFVVGNPSTNPMSTNTSSNGDRCMFYSIRLMKISIFFF